MRGKQSNGKEDYPFVDVYDYKLYAAIHNEIFKYKQLKKAEIDVSDYVIELKVKRSINNCRQDVYKRLKILPRSYGFVLIDIDDKEAEPWIYSYTNIPNIQHFKGLYKLSKSWKRYLNEDYYPWSEVTESKVSQEQLNALYNYCDFLSKKSGASSSCI